MRTAAEQGLACCHVCMKLSPAEVDECPLCGASLHPRVPNSLQRTAALTLTGALLYVPANALPIMVTTQLGSSLESTILGGIIHLIHDGSWLIAGVIFAASVVVPLGKLFALTWLCWTVYRQHGTAVHERTRIYRVMEFIGKWSMTDVFVVAILVALVHLGGLMRVTPGPAAVAFGAMVVATMLAAESFDPRLMWDEWEEGAPEPVGALGASDGG